MAHAHHLEIDADHLAGNEGIGRYFLLPGSPGRAERIASRLEGVVRIGNRRRLDVFLGRRGDVDVGVVPTGMGCPSVDIVVGELLALGARRLLRVGTAGSLQPQVRIGDLVVATGAVRDEAASDAYTDREFPALACPIFSLALADAAVAAGLGERVHAGIVHSKDSFFGREFGRGPDAERNRAYMERLARSGVLASEMEAAHLFVLGAVHGGAPTDVAAWRGGAARVRCAALLAVIGTPEAGIASLADESAAEERLIDVGLAGVGELARRERAPAARVSTLDHVSIAVSSLARSKAFYDAALAPLGIRPLMRHGNQLGYGRGQKPELWLVEGPASWQRPEHLAPITPVHVALSAGSRAEVDQFHAAALSAGAADFGPPGPRPEYHARYYGAFVLDPDGHNVEAVIHGG